MNRFLVLILAVLFLGALGPVFAADAPAPAMDIVTLKDGSVIYGEVVEMERGLLLIKNPSAEEFIKVKWSEVSTLKISHPVSFYLKEGSVLIGTVLHTSTKIFSWPAIPTRFAAVGP